MDREQALKLLSECQQCGDTEIAHKNADDVLCALLDALGYGDVVAEYRKVTNWFA
jgi:hypothetical protein